MGRGNGQCCPVIADGSGVGLGYKKVLILIDSLLFAIGLDDISFVKAIF